MVTVTLFLTGGAQYLLKAIGPSTSPVKENQKAIDVYQSILIPYSNRLCRDVCVISADKCSRRQLAQLLDTVHRYSEKPVGLDIYFEKDHFDEDTRMLVRAVHELNPVLPIGLILDQEQVCVGTKGSFFYDDSDALFGFVDLFDAGRRMYGSYSFGDSTLISFSGQLYELEKKEKVPFENPYYVDYLNYRFDSATCINSDDVLFSTEMHEQVLARIRQSVVLIGCTHDADDLHVTPVGKMAGVFIHAHSLGTLLDGLHVREMPSVLCWMIACVMLIFLSVFRQKKGGKSLILCRLAELLSIFVCGGCGLFLYYRFRLYFDIMPLIVLISVYIIVDEIVCRSFKIFTNG